LRLIERSFRLTNGPGGLGLSCTESGLSLAGVPLLENSEVGFVPRSATEIEALVRAAYDGDVAAADLLPGIHVIARALNRGEIAHAMTAAVLMRLPELGWNAAARLAHAEDRIGKYSPEEPRDWHGRWTTDNAAYSANQDQKPESPQDFGSDDELSNQNALVTLAAAIVPQDDTDDADENEPVPPDDRPPLERKYDALGPVEFAKKVIQLGLSLETDGSGFSPEQRQDALVEYNFLQNRLNFWLAYDDKPVEAQQNLLSAALTLYTGAVNGGIIPVGGKGGNLPASMVAVGTGILAADNGTPSVRLRGPAGGAEVEPEPVPLEHEPAEEEAPSPLGQLATGRTSHIVDELTRTGELGEVISNDEAKIGWDGGTNKGLDWENYNEITNPELTRLKPGAKGFDFFDDGLGEAVSDKALDPLCYSYINNPQEIYSKVKLYIDSAANYSRPRAWFDLNPAKINSRFLRLAVRNHISPEQWESLYRAVLYARSRGIKIKIWRID